MKAILLAGGKGTRLAPYTTILPKPLLPVGEMPILEVVIKQLKHFGITDFTLSVGYLSSLIQAYFGDGHKLGVTIHYSFEEQPLGTAGPISLVSELNEPFLVMNGDLLTTINYRDLIKSHISSQQIATISLAKREVKIDFGIVESTEDGFLDKYLEKPVLEHFVSMGIYIFSPAVLNFIPKNQYLDLPDLMMKLKSHHHKINIFKANCEWLDIGRNDDYQKANQVFLENKNLFLHSSEDNA